MKLQTKFALYNAISKILIILIFSALLPVIVEQVVYLHIDARLLAKKDKMLKIIDKTGLQQVEQDSSFGSYNLLKEEFISIESDSVPLQETIIENAKRNIEDEIVNYRVLSHPFTYKKQHYLLEIGEGLNTIIALNRSLQEFTLWMMVILIIISILLDIGFFKFLLRPFQTIVQNKLRNTKHPTAFDFQTIRTNTDDFHYLDKSINEMMQKIKDAFLIEKEFIANVSHELLTPISILQNRFENILTDGKISEQVALKIIESQKTLNRLSKIIKTLLLISNIENDQYLKEDNVSIKELITEVINEIEERLTEKKISLQCNSIDDCVVKNCNKSLLFTLFFNVINNAIKYNKPNGHITIKGYYEKLKYIVEVQDTGIGIEKEHLENIFDRFKRLNKSDSESYGLGLPIVKTIANFHHIPIDINSKVNEGTSFRLIFNNPK